MRPSIGSGTVVRALLAALVATTLIAACGSSGGDDDAGARGDTFGALLAHVPDTAENRRFLILNDYDRALAVVGATWPDPTDDAEVTAGLDLLVELTTSTEVPVLLLGAGFERPVDVAAWRREFGFSVFDATAEAYAGAPPTALWVVRTSRDAADIDAAVRADPVWGPEVVEVAVGDAHYLTWSDPLAIEADRVSDPRPLGRGGVIAAIDAGTVLRALDVEVVEASLRAAAGDEASMADDAAFAAVAAHLDELGAHSAFLTAERYGPEVAVTGSLLGSAEADADDLQQRIDDLTALPPYLALGIGQDVDGDGVGLVQVVVATASEADAAATVEAMTRIVEEGTSVLATGPWSEHFTVRAGSTDGPVAVVVLEAAVPRTAFDAFVRRDSLFVSG